MIIRAFFDASSNHDHKTSQSSSSLTKYSTALNTWLMGWSKGSLNGEPKYPSITSQVVDLHMPLFKRITCCRTADALSAAEKTVAKMNCYISTIHALADTEAVYNTPGRMNASHLVLFLGIF